MKLICNIKLMGTNPCPTAAQEKTRRSGFMCYLDLAYLLNLPFTASA